MLGELITLWSIRLAMVCYVGSLSWSLLQPPERHARHSGRFLWTAGCLLYLLHVVCAFEFFHNWSHGAAEIETARQTRDVVGWDWGGGIYVNYLFTLVWAVDAAWWWANATGYQCRPRWMAATIHVFLFFVAFNATVVFGSGAIRWVGLAATIWLAALVIHRRFRRSRRGHDAGPRAINKQLASSD